MYDTIIYSNNMNIPLLIANILAFAAFFVHVFKGDKALQFIEPLPGNKSYEKQQRVWTMARGAFHIISVDVFCLNILLLLMNFSHYIPNEKVVLKLLAIYFFLWTIVYAGVILISRPFEKRFIKLGQWILFIVLSGLLYWASV
jgi:hypothetical protein